MSKILVSCCSYCTRGPSKGRCWQWILIVDAWCIAPQNQWEIESLLVFPATVSNNVLSLLHTVRALYKRLKKHLVVNKYSAAFQTVALKYKTQVLISLRFIEHGLFIWSCIQLQFSFAQLEVTGEQHTFNDDLRGSVHKPKTDSKHDLMTYVRLSQQKYLHYYVVTPNLCSLHALSFEKGNVSLREIFQYGKKHITSKFQCCFSLWTLFIWMVWD